MMKKSWKNHGILFSVLSGNPATVNKSSPWVWKGVSDTSQSGRYTLLDPRGRCVKRVSIWQSDTVQDNVF